MEITSIGITQVNRQSIEQISLMDPTLKSLLQGLLI